MSDDLPQLYLVRHGQTAWSLSGQHTGRSDIPLTEQGEQDARALRAMLGSRPFGWVLSSPLQRALRTAELAGMGEVVQTDADLLEWDYGSYEGRRTAEIRVEHPDWNAFEHGCPGGETLEDVAARAARLIARIRTQRKDTLVFAHRDILRVVIACWVQLPPIEGRRFDLQPGSVSVLGYDHKDFDEPIIRSLNTAAA